MQNLDFEKEDGPLPPKWQVMSEPAHQQYKVATKPPAISVILVLYGIINVTK